MHTERPEDLLGRTVVDRSGARIGTATELYLGTPPGGAGWVAVRTGILGDHVSPVPLLDAELDDTGRLVVAFPKRLVTAAPHHDASMALSVEEEATLFEHFGLDLTARRTTSVATHPGDVPAPGHHLTEDALGDSGGLHEGAGQATRLRRTAQAQPGEPAGTTEPDELQHDVAGPAGAIYPDDAVAEALADDNAARERAAQARRAEGR